MTPLSGSMSTGERRLMFAKELADRHHATRVKYYWQSLKRERETAGDVGGTIVCSHGKSTRSTNNTWYSHAGPKVHESRFIIYYEC